MNWKHDEDRLVAVTDFGDYVIRMTKKPPQPVFEVTLFSGDATHMKGEYESIGRATEAAEADLRHRELMWETL